MNKVIFAVAVIAGLVSCGYAACDFSVIGKCSDDLGKKSGGQQDKSSLCRIYGEFKSCLGSMQDCDLSDTLKTMEDSLKQSTGVDLGTCAAGGADTGAGAGGTCDFEALVGCTDILATIGDVAQDMAKLCSVVSDYKRCLAAQKNCDTSAQMKSLDDIAKGANMDLNACDTSTCDYKGLMKCSEILQTNEGASQDKGTLCRVFGQYKGCLAEQKNCNTSTFLKQMEETVKEVGVDLSTCSSGMVQVSIVCVLLAFIASFFAR